jgi:hypothetical protein
MDIANGRLSNMKKNEIKEPVFYWAETRDLSNLDNFEKINTSNIEFIGPMIDLSCKIESF